MAVQAMNMTTLEPISGAVTGNVAGASFRFVADDPDLLAYAGRHLAPLVSEEEVTADVDACLFWHEVPPPAAEARDARLAEMERWDRDLYVGPGRLAWFRIDACRDLHLRVEWDGKHLRVRGDYYFYLSRSRVRDHAKRWWYGARLRERRAKRYTTLLYYLVYYPAFWWNETVRGRHPIHAAGVVTDRGAVVLAGPSGVGKSTLSVALAATGDTFLSETFLLHRGTEVWPVREPILLDGFSRNWLGDAMAGLEPLGRDFVFGRHGYHRLAGLAERGNAAVLLVPRRAPQTYLRPIAPVEAHRRISASGQLIRDQRRYAAFAAALEALAARGLIEQRELELRRLAEGASCFEFGLGPGLTREAAVAMVRELLDERAGGRLQRAQGS